MSETERIRRPGIFIMSSTGCAPQKCEKEALRLGRNAPSINAQ